MANCPRCGKVTKLYIGARTVCVDCDQPGVSQTRENLAAAVNEARRFYRDANVKVTDVTQDIPSGIPHPDGSLRISQAFQEREIARNKLQKALDEFNKFVSSGPDR